MPKTKAQKKDIIDSLADKVSRAKSIFFARFGALNVKENEELRKDLEAEGSEYYVAKKTLLDIALKNLKLDNLSARKLDGRIATVFGYQDEMAPAKAIDKFREKNKDKIEFAGGVIDGRFYSACETEILAKLPGRTELYGQIVGSLNAPISGFVNALAGNLRNLVYVLKAIEEKNNS